MVFVPARQALWAAGIQSLESIPGTHKHLKIPATSTLDYEINYSLFKEN